MNLADLIKKQFPGELVNFLEIAGDAAQVHGRQLYLVGGAVRDLLLGRRNIDIDLVVEGDAVEMAVELAALVQGRAVKHARFGTATVSWGEWSADLATARSEKYAQPGALPTVRPGSIVADLFRRDFTVNAMALALDRQRYGELIDRFGGLADLEKKSLRVLHDRSFVDDATRIWRGIRYEQRLGFKLEPGTLELLKRSVTMLDTVSGDRIRHELERVLREDEPENALRRADELGVLARIEPALKADNWLAERFVRARQLSAPEPPEIGVYLALLTFRLGPAGTERVLSYLKFPNAISRVLRDVCDILSELELLNKKSLPPSAIYALLEGCNPLALTAVMLATDSAIVQERVRRFLTKLRHVRVSLTGVELAERGITGGRIKEILNGLRNAKLDGQIKTRADEERWVVGRV